VSTLKVRKRAIAVHTGSNTWPTLDRLNLTTAASELGLSKGLVELFLEYFYTGDVDQFNDVDIDSTEAPASLAPLISYFGFNDTPLSSIFHHHIIKKLS